MVEPDRTAKRVLELAHGSSPLLIESQALARTSHADPQHHPHGAEKAQLPGLHLSPGKPISVEQPSRIAAAAWGASVAGWRNPGRSQQDH